LTYGLGIATIRRPKKPNGIRGRCATKPKDFGKARHPRICKKLKEVN
jgi:hypothetical protein